MEKSKRLPKSLIYLSIAVVYFVLSLPFDSFKFPNGFSELRLTGLLPAAAGLLYGLPGALSCAAGNLAWDIINGFDIYCVFGFLGNFLAGWLPYKLWHTLFAYKGPEIHYVDSAGAVLKFALVSAISACGEAGVIAAGGQLLGGFSFSSFFIPVALQYYALSVLAGMLVFHVCVSVFHLVPHIPEDAYKFIRRWPSLEYVLCAVLVVLSLASVGITGNSSGENAKTAAVLSAAVLADAVIVAILPFKRGGQRVREEKAYREVAGLKAQFITLFLVTLCGFFIFFTTMCFRMLYVDFRYSNVGDEKLSMLWIRVILSGAAAATVFIIVMAVALKIIQRNVVEPIGKTAAYAGAFADGGELKQEQLYLKRTGSEIDQLGRSVNVMSEDIRRYVKDIKAKTAREEYMAAQLAIARSIQLGMLPGRWMGTGFGVVPYIKPAKEVGGDFYYFKQQDECRVFVCIADVSGKDVSAAMFMARTKTLIEAYADLPPGNMLTRINQALSEGNEAMMFVTLFAAVIDRENLQMSYANAGHNPPVYYSAGHAAWLEDEPDPPLGIMEQIQYQQHVLEITREFRLFIYTDGVNEAQNAEEEFFGNERILQTVEDAALMGLSDEELIKRMDEELISFTQDAEQSDDITMMAVSIKA